MSSLNIGSTMQGNIDRIVVDKPNQTASIQPHQMNIPYGNLIMNVLMKILPQMVNVENESHQSPETFGQVVEFFIGKGAAGYHNKNEDIKAKESEGTDNPYIPEYVSETGGCSSFAVVLSETFKELSSSISSLFSTSLLNAFCRNFINIIDEEINRSFDELASYHNIVQFSSNNCDLVYSSTETQLVSFSSIENESSWYGAEPDKRCTWDIKVGGSSDCVTNDHGIESNCTTGKFFAITQNHGD